MAIFTDPQGNPVVLYHGTQDSVEILDCRETVDGGLHFGTLEQAQMRNSRRVFHAHIDFTRARRSRDRGGDWKKRIQQAKAAGYDAIVYLNRYEGIDLEQFQQLKEKGSVSVACWFLSNLLKWLVNSAKLPACQPRTTWPIQSLASSMLASLLK